MDVFNLSNLPGQRLAVRTVTPRPTYIELGEFISILMRDQAQQVANMIVEERGFFQFEASSKDETVECRCDLVVMTLDDLVAMKRAAFSDGARHASGLMRYGGG